MYQKLLNLLVSRFLAAPSLVFPEAPENGDYIFVDLGNCTDDFCRSRNRLPEKPVNVSAEVSDLAIVFRARRQAAANLRKRTESLI